MPIWHILRDSTDAGVAVYTSCADIEDELNLLMQIEVVVSVLANGVVDAVHPIPLINEGLSM